MSWAVARRGCDGMNGGKRVCKRPSFIDVSGLLLSRAGGVCLFANNTTNIQTRGHVGPTFVIDV